MRRRRNLLLIVHSPDDHIGCAGPGGSRVSLVVAGAQELQPSAAAFARALAVERQQWSSGTGAAPMWADVVVPGSRLTRCTKTPTLPFVLKAFGAAGMYFLTKTMTYVIVMFQC